MLDPRRSLPLALCALLWLGVTGCGDSASEADAAARDAQTADRTATPDRPPPDAPLADAGPADGAALDGVADAAGDAPPADRSGDGEADGAPAGDALAGDGPDAAPPADSAPPGPTVTTLAGASSAGSTDGPATVARLNNPANLAVGPDGKIYVCDYDNNRIRRITAAGAVSTLAKVAGDQYPFGIAFSATGELYVQTDWNAAGDTETGALWQVSLTTGALTVVIDDVGLGRGLAPLPDGRFAMVDYQAHVVAIVDPTAKTKTVIAGAEGQAGFADGSGAAARFNTPYDAVFSAQGTIIVSDLVNHRLREVTLGGVVTTFAGDATAGNVDGPRLAARFDQPQGLAIDSAGAIYVSDVAAYRVRRIDPGGQVTTIAGDGAPGFYDGPALQARFYGLEGLDVTPDGSTVYIADGNRGTAAPYHRVRKLTLY